MTSQFLDFNQTQSLSLQFSAQQKSLFLKGFWIFSALSFFLIITAKVDLLSIFGALIIAVAALYPSYLWCCDRAKGLPLFPLLAINYLFTHSFPLIAKNVNVQEYSPTAHFISSLIVASFLVVATFTWLSYVQTSRIDSTKVKEFSKKNIFPFFISILILTIIYQITFSSGFLWSILPSSIVSTIRVITSSLAFFAVIIISNLLGKNSLKKNQAYLFLVTLTILIFVSGTSLYLNIPGFYVLFASLGWMLGSGKIPWRLLLISFLIIAFLNIGKGATRHYYWSLRNSGVKPSEYIRVYQNWINNSLKEIQQPAENILPENMVEKKTKDNSLINRSSVIQMLLKIQTETGTEKPYLWGKTYFIIPQLLIPRILNPNKIRGGEANHILSVYYGLQNYRQTITTSIGWGLLQEAYANFGWLGCMGLGVFLGNLYGWVTRWSMNTSSLSFRFLVSLIFVTLAFKVEVTMGIFISVIFQSLIILSAIRIFLMKTSFNNNSVT
ncbi:hypothetical protein Sta7437_2232 [Stanieria cyanosphaera PCC 7437]|uniref:O-antigen polymerase n=1 Tax=Stanieria cyanosphaera (strain ATCC 29371 / PCC 7437) TaxID=111780 RepID=K9XT48_STAC7|nr:hypothetical protein [Stanieria cyanosphaera]AFZ35780.1 hypothetical protein Sta7437_2232 [Stanieria cyanosphaera PCC 7437]